MNISDLINKVRARQRVDAIVKNIHKFGLILLSVYLLVFLASRTLSLIPDGFTLATVFVPLGLAMILAFAFTKEKERAHSAAALDDAVKSPDLFLTAELIESSAGDYQNIVLEQAQRRAENVNVQKVIPYQWSDQFRNIGIALGLLILMVAFLPQLDPFGYNEVRAAVVAQEKDLEKSERATAERKDILKRQEGLTKKSVDTAMANLKMTYKDLKPKEVKQNLAKLNKEQKKVGEMWRKLSEKKLRQNLERKPQQKFGSGRDDKSEKWKKDLAEGKTEAINKAIDDIKKKIDELKNEKDAAKKQKLQSEIKKKVEEMKDAVGKGMNAAQAENSLKRALEELAMSDMGKMSKESLEAMKKSLELTKKELEQLGDEVQALKEMEEMLESIQKAKQANQKKDGIDGKDLEGCESIQDYTKKYEEWAKQQQELGESQPCPGCEGTGEEKNAEGEGVP